MAVDVSLGLSGRDTGIIVLTLSGTLNTTVASIDVDVVDPNNVAYSFELAPQFFAVPATLPQSYNVTPEMIGMTVTDYFDGAYSFTVTTNYTDASDETSITEYILFNNNAVTAWVNFWEEESCNSGVQQVSSSPLVSASREAIQAASEAFLFSRFTEAKRNLDWSFNVSTGVINTLQ